MLQETQAKRQQAGSQAHDAAIRHAVEGNGKLPETIGRRPIWLPRDLRDRRQHSPNKFIGVVTEARPPQMECTRRWSPVRRSIPWRGRIPTDPRIGMR